MSSGTTIQTDIERIFTTIKLEGQLKKEPPHVEVHKKRVIVLAGPTGCGKSAIGIMLAQAIGGEIISADSMQVYRGMDIGTAKVSKAEREKIPHHLIDIRHITENFNVVDFCSEAKHCCQKIHDRDSTPIIVGGSGFYIHSFLYGPPNGPPSIPEIRREIEAELEKIGPEELYKQLIKMDSNYAETITSHDKHKIVRALEIIKITGKPVSHFAWKSSKLLQNYDFHCWFLHRPRTTLYHRIEKRCDKMIDEGLIDEVIALEKEGIQKNPTAAQAIGYRQTLEYLKTSQTRDEYKKYLDDFKKDTRHYAKRQFTWFRNEIVFQYPHRWLDLDLHDPETVVDMIVSDFETFR